VHHGGQGASVESSAHFEKGFHGSRFGAQSLRNEHGSEVGGDGIESAAGDDAGSFGLGFFVIAIDQGAHPGGFAGDIDVMGAEADAGVYESGAVDGEGAGGG
jgi:hypothetical protein